MWRAEPAGRVGKRVGKRPMDLPHGRGLVTDTRGRGSFRTGHGRLAVPLDRLVAALSRRNAE